MNKDKVDNFYEERSLDSEMPSSSKEVRFNKYGTGNRKRVRSPTRSPKKKKHITDRDDNILFLENQLKDFDRRGIHPLPEVGHLIDTINEHDCQEIIKKRMSRVNLGQKEHWKQNYYDQAQLSEAACKAKFNIQVKSNYIKKNSEYNTKKKNLIN